MYVRIADYAWFYRGLAWRALEACGRCGIDQITVEVWLSGLASRQPFSSTSRSLGGQFGISIDVPKRAALNDGWWLRKSDEIFHENIALDG